MKFSACLLLAGVCPWLEAQEVIRMDVRPPDYRFRFLPQVRVPEQRRMALALGGGAAKGIAHIGVLQRLEEEGLLPDSVTGTSAGALVGGAWCAGYTGESIQELFQRVDIGKYLLDTSRRSHGETLSEQETRASTLLNFEIDQGKLLFQPVANAGVEIKRVLLQFLGRGSFYGGHDFSRLAVPFRAVTTNLEEGGVASLDTGSLVEAIRASIAIPGMFRPVVLGKSQYVDGMLVENLPVREARKLDPEALVLAVEVGSKVEVEQSNNVFSILARTLDIAIEQQTRISRQDSDQLLRPDTRSASYLDFNRQVATLVFAGRVALLQGFPKLESALYGPAGDEPLPEGVLVIDAPPDLLPRDGHQPWQLLPQGSRRKDAYGMLRRLLALGLARDACLHLPRPGDPPLLRLVLDPFPAIQTVLLDTPEAWKGAFDHALQKAGLRPGQRFNPREFGLLLNRMMLEGAIQGCPLMDFRGSGFEEKTGCLRVQLREPVIQEIRIEGEHLGSMERAYLDQLFRPMLGSPIEANRTLEKMLLGEARLNLQEIQLQVDAMPTKEGAEDESGQVEDLGACRLRLRPLAHRRTAINASLGLESTWGTHINLNARLTNLFATAQSLELQLSQNRFQEWGRLGWQRAMPFSPTVGYEVFLSRFHQRFLKESLSNPLLAPYAAQLEDRYLRADELGLGVYWRFGRGDRGMASLSGTRREATVHPMLNRVNEYSNNAQISMEWDDFDRHGFPAQGKLFRFMGGYGDARLKETGRHWSYKYAYLRARALKPLSESWSLDLDVESGFGWDTNLDRWFILGGPSSLIGSRSAGYLCPNFALGRLAVPWRIPNNLGLRIQLEPRYDFGYIGGDKPNEIRQGWRAQGYGLLLRTEVSRFYLELAWGRAEVQDSDQSHRPMPVLFNILVGVRPFDIWKRK